MRSKTFAKFTKHQNSLPRALQFKFLCHFYDRRIEKHKNAMKYDNNQMKFVNTLQKQNLLHQEALFRFPLSMNRNILRYCQRTRHFTTVLNIPFYKKLLANTCS